MITIKIITGSTRPGRFNIQPATWMSTIAKERTDINLELVDLADINLPFLDESKPALSGEYSKDHTKAWSAKVGEADGFIFVTPEYNHSYSPVLKNAIDFLFKEWNFKPVAFLSYGAAAGGSRAIEHLRTVVAQLKMYDLYDHMILPNYWEKLNDKGEYQFSDEQKKAANTLLDSLAFWAQSMKEARAKMTDMV